jgi:hypothetical protein
MYPFGWDDNGFGPQPDIYEMANVPKPTFCFLVKEAAGRRPLKIRNCVFEQRASEAFKWLLANAKGPLKKKVAIPYVRVEMEERDAVLFKTFWL